MKKGFTLIELLAVIVILAIIALIAVPIILEIINNTKEESNKRSIEMYAKAIKNSVAQAQLSNNENISGSFTPSNNGKTLTNDKTTLKVKYDGNVVCDITNINLDGTIYLAKCKVDNTLVEEYTYGKSNIPTPVSFAEDEWSTIVANVKAGNISVYEKNLKENKNNTKTIKITSRDDDSGNADGIETGEYKVRIANTSTPDECSTEGFSQTACGFVIEFEDIIAKHNMNPTGEYKGTQYSTGWNVDGYPASLMYTYIQNDIYNALPPEIKDNIIPTFVVSGHGSTSGEENFVTGQDKLYLLSTKEVWGKEGTSKPINYDTAEAETRQLDYYKNIGVTTNNYSGAIKKYKGTAYDWWLRSAVSNETDRFYYVDSSGDWNNRCANYANGVAVAFRLG